jgi:hypothetical protein
MSHQVYYPSFVILGHGVKIAGWYSTAMDCGAGLRPAAGLPPGVLGELGRIAQAAKLWWRNPKVVADLAGDEIVDFAMSWNR